MKFVIVDVESDGPCPGLYSIVCFGAVIVDEKLDKNRYLLCFKNGVYDFQNKVFRAGRPEDYISRAVPIDYIKFSENDKRVQDVLSLGLHIWTTILFLPKTYHL